MSTDKDYKNFILEQLDLIEDIACRHMMGEYLLYCKGKIFGGIYDNRLLVKITDEGKKLNLKEEIPYSGAKPMYFVENIDDKEYLKIVVETVYNSL